MEEESGCVKLIYRKDETQYDPARTWFGSVCFGSPQRAKTRISCSNLFRTFHAFTTFPVVNRAKCPIVQGTGQKLEFPVGI